MNDPFYEERHFLCSILEQAQISMWPKLILDMMFNIIWRSMSRLPQVWNI